MSTTQTRTAELSLTAAEVLPGDVLVTYDLSGETCRTRIREVTTHRLAVWRGAVREDYDAVRLHSLGSEDYAPDFPVTIIRHTTT